MTATARALLALLVAGCAPPAAVDASPPAPSPTIVQAPSGAARALGNTPYERLRSVEAALLAAEPKGEDLVDAYVESCAFSRLSAAREATGARLVVGDECDVPGYEQNCSLEPSPCWGDVAFCRERECSQRCSTCSGACVPVCDACKALCSDAACVRRCAVDRAACRDACVTAVDVCRTAECNARYEPCLRAWRTARDARCGAGCRKFESCTRDEHNLVRPPGACDALGRRLAPQCRSDCRSADQ